jgi:hypothetical protein
MASRAQLALTQDRAFHLWVLSKPLPAMVKTASLALGEIPSVPEKGPKRAQQQWPRLRLHVQRVIETIQAATPGSFAEVEIPSR